MSPAVAAVPREVRWAGLALWVVGALSALNGLLAVLTRGAQVDDLRASDTVLTDAEIEQSVTLGVGIRVLLAVAIATLAGIAAVNAPRRRRWARVCATVVASITAAFAVLRIVGGGSAVPVSVVLLLASVATLVLLYRRPASSFFAGP